MSTTASTSANAPVDPQIVQLLKDRYECPFFRLLILGRANAGKTTILEKVCGVDQGTRQIVRKPGNPVLRLLRRPFEHRGSSSREHLRPTVLRGKHDVKNEITYKGSNFIFHDSCGIEAGEDEEMKIVHDFIRKKSTRGVKLKDRLHAIWYCIPLDTPRLLAEAELSLFKEGTGTVPLIAVFTKFDGLELYEYGKLRYIENEGDRWAKAKANAEELFKKEFLNQIMNTPNPPKAFVKLGGMDQKDVNCPELTEKTATAIDIGSLQQLFTSVQMNNLELCIKRALQDILDNTRSRSWDDLFVLAAMSFPHFWKPTNWASIYRHSSE